MDRWLSILFTLLLGSSLFSQGAGSLPLRIYGVQQGMASEVVSALAQDSQGLIWAGTEAGLHFFNGQTFEPFPGDLPSQMVLDILPDADGSLWVATQGGLAWLGQGRSASFGPEQGIPKGRVQALARDGQGHFWVLTTSGLLVETGPKRFGPAPELPSNDLPSLLFAHPTLPGAWVVAGRGLWHWDSQDVKWKALDAPTMVREEAILGLTLDGTNQMWLRTSRNLWRCQPGGTWQLSRGRLEGGFSVHARLERDAQGWVWFDDPQGLWRARGEEQECFVPRSVVGRGALVDRDGGIWLRTQKGVAQVMGGMRWRSYGTLEGLPSPTVWRTIRDPQGRLWVPTEEGLCVSEGAGWKRVIPTRTLGVLIGPNNTLWASGSPGGIVQQVDLRTLAVKSHRVEVLPVGRIVSGFAMDKEGRLWVADEHEGLARGRWNGSGWTWERILVDGKELKDIRNLVVDSDGRVFAAHLGGIAVWDHGRWSQLADVLDALPSNLAFDGRGGLIVSYLNRPVLTRFSLVGGVYRSVELLNPIPHRPQILVFSLGYEANGRLWIGTSQGIARLEIGRPGSLRLFDMDDGLVSSDCDEGSLFVDKGRVWIGTSQGLASYRTDLPEEPISLRAPLLLSAQSGGKALPLKSELMVLPRDSRNLELRFLVPNFQAQGRMIYQARLKGVDSNWVNLEQPRIRYPSMPPGRYLLELRGTLEEGQPGPTLAVRFEVLPRWWESGFAWFCYALLGAGAVLGLVRLRQARLESRNRELREEVNRQTRAVQLASQAKSAFLANMSHELRTPLNAILLYAELLQEDATEHGLKNIQADASKIHGAGRHLLGLIDDILDVSKIEAGHMKLEVAELEMGPFLADLIATLEPMVERNSNQFHADLALAPLTIWTDALRLRQVLSNLLSNAGKFTEHGEITLRVETADEDVCFSVHDTGIGMTEEELNRVFQEFVQADTGTTRKYGGTGLGLALVRRLTGLLGGRVDAKSESGVGTTFTVRLPLRGPD